MKKLAVFAAACALSLSLTGCYDYGPPAYGPGPAAYAYPAYAPYPGYYAPYGVYGYGPAWSVNYIYFGGHYYDRHYYYYGPHGPRPISRSGTAPRPLDRPPAHETFHSGAPRETFHAEHHQRP